MPVCPCGYSICGSEPGVRVSRLFLGLEGRGRHSNCAASIYTRFGFHRSHRGGVTSDYFVIAPAPPRGLFTCLRLARFLGRCCCARVSSCRSAYTHKFPEFQPAELIILPIKRAKQAQPSKDTEGNISRNPDKEQETVDFWAAGSGFGRPQFGRLADSRRGLLRVGQVALVEDGGCGSENQPQALYCRYVGSPQHAQPVIVSARLTCLVDVVLVVVLGASRRSSN